MNAKDCLRHFDIKDGVVFLKDGAPEWVKNVVYSAHGGMLPDDTRFSMVLEALEEIAEGSECPEREPPIYTSDLFCWLTSNLARAEYVDQAIQEHGAKTLFEAMQIGWSLEYSEVFAVVRDSLGEVEE